MLIGQFTYATVAEPGPYSDTSGWKVARVSGDAQALRPWVEKAARPLGTFSPQTIPLLATDAEIQALPRRLRLEISDAEHVALLHQINAGRSNDHRDSSFTHALLVRPEAGNGLDRLRPAQLWHSSAWLCPRDANQVRAAELLPNPDFSAGVPRSQPVEATWVTDKNLALLLLSILEAGWSGRSGAVCRVALVDPSGAETVRWVDFLGRHVTVGATWTGLGFSTHETALDGRAAALSGLRIIGLPESESDSVRRSFGRDWVVLDPRQPVGPPSQVEGQGLGWQYAGGRFVPLGAWAQLAERLTLLDEMGMGSIAELLDRIEIECAGSSDNRPLWALPAGLLIADEPVRQLLGQVLGDAVDLVRKHFPPGLAASADTRDTLLKAVAEHSAEPIEAFADMLRSADAAQGQADAVVEGYLRALWGAGPDGSVPDWVNQTGPLPWLPQESAPSPALADRLLAGLPGLLAWSGALPDDPDRTERIATGPDGIAGPGPAPRLAAGAQVRILACVAELFARWGLADRPPISTVIAPRLVSVMMQTLRAGTPVAAGGWPVLPPSVFEAIAAQLQDWLAGGGQLTAPVVNWLDQQCGPLPADRTALVSMSRLDLDRARYAMRAAGTALPADAVVLRCATVLRDALPPTPPQPVDWWLGALRFALGPQAALEDVQWLLSVLAERGVQVPTTPIAEALVRGYQWDPAAAAFAGWALGSAVAQRIETTFPGLATQQACRPELPVSPDLAGDQRWARELSALAEMAGQPDCPLRTWALPRLAADLLLLAAPLAVSGRWPWTRDPAPVLVGQWAAGFELLDRGTAGQQARRLDLASALFVRSLIAEQLSGRTRYPQDPAGQFLIERIDPGKDEWRVESLVSRLVAGVERADKQQWVDEVRAEAKRACAAVPGAPDWLAPNVATMVEQNAPTIALGAFGSRLPWGRARSQRPAGQAEGDPWVTWNR